MYGSYYTEHAMFDIASKMISVMGSPKKINGTT